MPSLGIIPFHPILCTYAENPPAWPDLDHPYSFNLGLWFRTLAMDTVMSMYCLMMMMMMMVR
ncbi:hypothetical protein K440DRAFT_613444 [Wilcoxina mikolae CBS 423.85]|nr:hypothetical protein K440DRAFT_613444 [Wilcoxina mikolae CBS 423.85]